MKRFLVLFLLFSLLLPCLAGCSQTADSDAPEGYQLISDATLDGFSLYVPQGWTSYYTGNLCCAYVSSIDASSISCGAVVSALSPKEYFEASRADYEATFTDFSVLEQSDSKINGKEAYTVAFTGALSQKEQNSGEYKDVAYGYRQAIVDGGEGILFVLTCQANAVKADENTASRFEQHSQSFIDIIGYFKVNGAPQARPEPSFDAEAPEGMKCASDKRILGCLVFVPSSWSIEISDGLVAAKAQDGTNVQAMKLFNNILLKEYFQGLVDSYKQAYEKVVVEQMPSIDAPEHINGYMALRLKLTVTHQGQVYYVEQVMIRDAAGLNQGAYLFTFTAKTENAQQHMAEWEAIVNEVVMS